LKNSPRNSAQDLSNEEGLNVGRCEEDGGEGSNEDEAGHDGVAIAKALRDEAVDEEADDFANGGTLAAVLVTSTGGQRTGERAYITEAGLPRRRHLVRAVGELDAVLAVELRESIYRL